MSGGWANVGYTPREVIIKEFKEEAGLDTIPEALLTVFDKRMHAHPPQPFYVYKIVFYCKTVTSELMEGFAVLDVKYFDILDLPALSKDRILKSQIELLYKKVIEAEYRCYFD